MIEDGPPRFGCFALVSSTLCCLFFGVLPGAPLKLIFGGGAWGIGLYFAIKAMPNQGSGINRLSLAIALLILVGFGGLMALGIVFKLLGGHSVVSPFM